MAAPTAVSMLPSLAYQLIDLYYVAGLGAAALAGVSAAATLGFVAVALSQVIGAGTVIVVAHALGRGDRNHSNFVLNQSFTLSIGVGICVLLFLAGFDEWYMRLIAADQATIDAGVTFIVWMLPGFVALMPLAAMMAALRAAGQPVPAIAVQALVLAINALLAPVLIGGWGTGLALGVQGAGMATSISTIVGALVTSLYIQASHSAFRLDRRVMWPLQPSAYRRIFVLGLPVGGEIALMFLLPAVVLYGIREFGVASQAGYGLGIRVTQIILLPGLSIAMAVAPIVGQTIGAANSIRSLEVLRKAIFLGVGLMATTTFLLQVFCEDLVGLFNAGEDERSAAVDFLRIVSLGFIAQSIVTTSSSMFQGLGNTLPPLISSVTCFCLFCLAVAWLSSLPNRQIEQVWYLLVGTLLLQAAIGLWLLKRQIGDNSVSAASKKPCALA